MLSINIQPIMRARGIEKPFSFLVKSGFSRHSASSIAEGSLVNIKLEHIEKLCRILVCLPQDIFEWRPSKGDNLPAGHPLHTLKPTETLPDWKTTFQTLPYDQLKQIVKNIPGAEKQ